MKKIFLSIVLMSLYTTFTFAQQVISTKGDKLNLSDFQIEPWNVVGTTNKATLNNQNIFLMGNVGIGTNAPNATLHVSGNAHIHDLVDGGAPSVYPRKVVVKTDGTLGFSLRQFVNKTVLAAAGTPFIVKNTINATAEVTAANGNFTSVKGGLLYVMGDAQLSNTDVGYVTIGFSLWIDGVSVAEIRQYFPTASNKRPFELNFIIPNIAVGNHTWQLKFNGNPVAAGYSYVDANHKYQLKMVEVGS